MIFMGSTSYKVYILCQWRIKAWYIIMEYLLGKISYGFPSSYLSSVLMQTHVKKQHKSVHCHTGCNKTYLFA